MNYIQASTLLSIRLCPTSYSTAVGKTRHDQKLLTVSLDLTLLVIKARERMLLFTRRVKPSFTNIVLSNKTTRGDQELQTRLLL